VRIYITGANGLVGRELMREASARHEVVNTERIDVRDAVAVSEAIGSTRPDWVIHLAAFTDVDGAEARNEEAHAVNADGTSHVARGARAAGARLLVMSTDYVFDGEKGAPYVEEDFPAPLCAYGRSKLAGERVAKAVLPDCLIARSSWIYGQHRRNFVDAILDQAGKPQITVVEDEEGSPTYAVDLARGLLELVDVGARGIVHVVNAGGVSRADLARAVLRLAGENPSKVVPTTRARLGRPAMRPAYSVLSTARYQSLAGQPLRSWEDALADYVTSRRSSEAAR
jgi:dTDP-4-dehydrorhamnose reductase